VQQSACAGVAVAAEEDTVCARPLDPADESAVALGVPTPRRDPGELERELSSGVDEPAGDVASIAALVVKHVDAPEPELVREECVGGALDVVWRDDANEVPVPGR
jgi:hypothetical protein